MAGVKSIATKVMIQINCKLGGAPWMIKFPMKGVMAVGFDVTHDTRDRSKSFGAFVASMDLKEKVNFFSASSAHRNGEEISNNIASHMVQALREFKEQHGALPDRIFFYRDGVGEGDIERVHKMEVKALLEKLDGVYSKFGTAKPKLTFIIVNKRINTRIFLKQGTKFANPNAGTVVDNTITLPERFVSLNSFYCHQKNNFFSSVSTSTWSANPSAKAPSRPPATTSFTTTADSRRISCRC